MDNSEVVQQLTVATVPSIAERFPQFEIESDSRAGYAGFIVPAKNLIELAVNLRDVLKYDFLSSVTGVDYEPEGKLEVVYHLFRTLGGPALVLKVQVPRENPVVPSLYYVYRSAELQEREAWDLLGIRFEGHPDLRRLLTWEGFAGHPLRKDWKEPFYEEEVKPYKNRWPEGGIATYIEDSRPFKDNTQYPKNFDPDKWIPDEDDAIYKSLKSIRVDDPIKTEQMIINFGPQHPSTHGVFRMVATLDGETIVDVKPVIGYLHRNHEKIGERCTWLQIMPFTDRLDYVCSMSNNFGYALAVEKLMGIKPTERAEYLRVLMAELTRVLNHIFSLGFLLNDLGAWFTPMIYALEERELILDVFEAVSGSRMMCNYMRFGGVVRDLPEGVMGTIKELVYERLPRMIEELNKMLSYNELLKERTVGTGVITAEQAINNGASGPMLRGSGVPYDIRRADPYSIYDQLEFDVVTGTHGDVYDRYLLRLEEARQSVRILKQVIERMSEGPILAGKPTYQARVPAGEAYGRVESPKGELGFYVVSNGKPNPWRYHIRSGSMINLTNLADMCRGHKIADAVVNLGSIDIVLGEVDR